MPTLGIVGDEICEDAARHGITFFYMWAGPLQLHYTALPRWGQYLGMTFSVMRLIPSWASAGNALLTLNGAWHKIRDEAVLRFMMIAAVEQHRHAAAGCAGIGSDRPGSISVAAGQRPA